MDLNSTIPASVVVHFLRCAPNHANGPIPVEPYDTAVTVPLSDWLGDDAATVPPSLTGLAGSPEVHHVRDTAQPCTASTNDLKKVAAGIAHAFWGWRSMAYDESYYGMLAPAQTGFTDTVEWTWGPDEGDDNPAVTTRIRTAPYNCEPDQFPHAISTCDPCLLGIWWGTIPANTTVSPGSTVIVTLTKNSLQVHTKNKDDDIIPTKSTPRKCRVYIDEFGDWTFLNWDCS